MKTSMSSLQTLLGLVVTAAIIFEGTAVEIPGSVQDRLDQLAANLTEVEQEVDDLTVANTKLRRDIDDPLPHPVDPLPPVKPGHHGYHMTEDCCEADLIRKDCWEKVDGLPLTVLGNGVYYFFTDFSNGLTWFRAQDFCRRHGMQLVSIEDMQENSLLRTRVQLLLSGQADSRSFFWTSLNDLSTENTFMWAGTGQSPGFTDWHLFGNQPDNLGDEDCGEMWQVGSVGNVHWNDRKCTGWKGRFICEMPQPCADLIRHKAKNMQSY